MSDRLDDTLRHLARADVPADLSARVRVALETGSASATLRPQLAAATLVALFVTGGWLVMNRAGGTFVSPAILPESATSSSAGASAAADVPITDVDTGRTSVSPSTVRAGGTSLRAGGAFLSVASAKVEVPPVSDHEHALPSLADIAAVGPAALSTPPMLVEAAEIAPLAPIAPMNIPALDAGEGERR